MTIQGVPDLGPGLRLHLNENTGGCSPKVVEAVRAFDGDALATYPDFRDAILETAAFLGVDPDRIVLTNGLDEGILLASVALPGQSDARGAGRTRRVADGAVGYAGGRRRAAGVRAVYQAARTRWARVSWRCRPARTSRFRSTACFAPSRRTRASSTSTIPNNPSGQPIAEGRHSSHRARGRPRAGLRRRGVSRFSRRELPCRSRRLSERAGRAHVLEGVRAGRHARRRDDRVAGDPRADPQGACRSSISTSSPSRRYVPRSPTRPSATWYIGAGGRVEGAGLCGLRTGRAAGIGRAPRTSC